MDFENTPEIDIYDVPEGNTYASTTAPNNTLTLLVGANEGNYEEVHRSITTQGAAYVAAQRAIQERKEEVDLWQGAAKVKAEQGDVTGLQGAIKQIQDLKLDKPASYVEDTDTIARATIERLAAQSGKSPEEIIRLAQLRSRNLAVKSALEIAIQAMPERGALMQFGQDVIGATTLEDWGMMAPTVHSFAKQYGFDGPRAFTKAGATESVLTVLRQASAEDAPKIIQHLADTLTKAVGGTDARRFFEQLNSLTVDSAEVEGLFGALDVVGLAALAKGAMKAVWRGSNALKVAREVGQEKAVVDDLLSKLTADKSALGASKGESVEAAVASSTLSDLRTLAPQMHKQLEERTEKLLTQLKDTLYTGGATPDEVQATVRRLEAAYAKEVNPSIVDSAKIVGDEQRGSVKVDVLYGRHDGKLFDTAEEALDYWKTRKAGTLEAVRLNGSPDEIQASIRALAAETKQLIVDLKTTQQAAPEVTKKIETLQAEKAKLIESSPTPTPKVQEQAKAIDEEVAKLESSKVDVEQKAEQLSEAIANLSLKREQLENSGIDKWAVRQKVDFPVFTDDISTITVDELDKIQRGLGVANPRFLATKSLFQGAVSSMYKNTRMRELYKGFIEPSFNKLNKHQLEKVDEALTASDKIKRNLEPTELSALGLGDDEVEAYYAYRTMRDIQWQVKNAEAVRDLTAKGNQYIKVTTDEVAFEGPAKALNLDNHVGQRFYDVENKKFVTVTQENLQELKTRGVLPYQYAKAQSVADVKSDITKVLAPVNNTMKGDIRQVVGKVDGSFSRIYMEEYWIKLNGKGLVDDTEVDISKAFRTSATEAQAKEYVKGFDTLQAARKAGKVLSEDDVVKAMGGFEKDAKGLADQFNNGDFDRFTISQNYTRMQDNFIRDVVGTGGGDLTEGRVFWSGRGEDAIKSITEGGTSAQTLGPLKSLEAELSNTSNYAATNEWRRNSIQKWFNTFADELSVKGVNVNDAESAFFDSVNKLKGLHGGTEREKQMMATRDFILNQMGVLTTQEKMVRSLVQKVTEGIDGIPVLNKIPGYAHAGHFLRKSNVPEWAKGVSSNLMLGMFNIGQLVVQSSGMALAASISPKHGLKAAMSIRPILVAMSSDNPSVWRKVFKAGNVAKDTGMSSSEFTEVAQAIRKVGLLDNIGASSLYTAEDGALNIYANKGVQKFQKAQMMFFNKGEEINRVAGFEIARREWMELNPGVKWNTDSALAEITARADDLTMNMTRVTEGNYQKGLIGIPFQFLQHSIKFGANVVGGAMGRGPLNNKEAMQLIAGSLVLFGMPGALEERMGDYLNGLSEQQKQYITQGLIAGVVSTVGETLTGERTNIALGTRLGNIDFYDDLFFGMIDLFSGEYTKIGKALTGPTGSTVANVMNATEIVGDFFGQDEKSFESFIRTVNDFGASMVSSWRAADKAYWAYHANGTLYNKRGDPVAKLTTPEWVFQAMSFQSTEAAEANNIFKTQQDYTRFIKRVSDDYIRLRGQSFKAFLAGDTEDADTKMRQANALVFALPPGDQQRIWSTVKQRATYGTVGEEAINKWAGELTSHKNRLMVTNPYGELNGN